MKFINLGELLANQAKLQQAMGHPTGEGEAGCKENILHIMVEAVEALREINFKPWKKGAPIQVDRAKLATELTDILQFWANAANAMGLTGEDLSQALRAKWIINYDRIGLPPPQYCSQCDSYGVHKTLCPQNFDAEDLRDGKLTPLR